MRKKDRQRKKAMKRVMAKLDRAFKRPGAAKKIAEEAAAAIHGQLSKQSISRMIFSTYELRLCRLDPPYVAQVDDNAVVHWTGVDIRDKHDTMGAIEDRRIVRFCDFKEAADTETTEAVTCLTCHANQKERTRPRSDA